MMQVKMLTLISLEFFVRDEKVNALLFEMMKKTVIIFSCAIADQHFFSRFHAEHIFHMV